MDVSSSKSSICVVRWNKWQRLHSALMDKSISCNSNAASTFTFPPFALYYSCHVFHVLLSEFKKVWLYFLFFLCQSLRYLSTAGKQKVTSQYTLYKPQPGEIVPAIFSKQYIHLLILISTGFICTVCTVTIDTGDLIARPTAVYL